MTIKPHNIGNIFHNHLKPNLRKPTSIAICWGLGIHCHLQRYARKIDQKTPDLWRYMWRMSIGSFTRQWLTKDLFSFFYQKTLGEIHPIGLSQCFFNRVAKNHQLLLYFWEVFNRHLPLCYQLFVGFNKRFKPHSLTTNSMLTGRWAETRWRCLGHLVLVRNPNS